MNFQPLIDNAPWTLASVGLVIWSLARLIEAKAKANPAQDAWDDWAPRASWASQRYSQAIEWLVQSGHEKWSGAEKLEQLNARVKGFEEQWAAGNYLEAITNLSGFYQAAKSKVEKAAAVTLPFAPRPSQAINPNQPQARGIGLDDPATENTDGK